MRPTIKKGMKVGWTLDNEATGWGYAICDEFDGHCLIAVHSDGPLHHVIYCASTWLEQLEAPPEVQLDSLGSHMLQDMQTPALVISMDKVVAKVTEAEAPAAVAEAPAHVEPAAQTAPAAEPTEAK